MQVQRQVEGSLPARTLTDLLRISNHTLRVLQSFYPTLGTGGRIHLYGVRGDIKSRNCMCPFINLIVYKMDI